MTTQSNPTASAIYYYVYNLQGDVIALVNSANGQIVARYDYDAWGKITAVTDANGVAITDQSHIAHVNPFRYRGYYYDNETGLYYLNTRYYDTDTCRFINADKYIGGAAGYNLFVYCFNNPINYCDYTGNSPVLPDLPVNLLNSNVKRMLNGESIVPPKDENGYDAINKAEEKLDEVLSNPPMIINDNAPKVPFKGPPGGSETMFRPDGTPFQKRWYGDDGFPIRDRDYSGHHGHPNPHDHPFDKEKGRGPYENPDPNYQDATATVAYAAFGTAAIYGGYLIVKWGVAAALAPVTGGGSLAIAAITP